MRATNQRLATIAIAVALLAPAATIRADESKTTIRDTPDGYSEAHKGKDGEYKYESNGTSEKSAYEGHGVQAKTSTNGVKSESVYQDKHCQQKTVTNAATGETKEVAEGNCAR